MNVPKNEEIAGADGIATMRRGPADDPLIPIRIELDVEGHHVIESFTWNLEEKRMTPEVFARVLCGDLGLGAATEEVVAESMREQIAGYVKRDICRPDTGEFRQIVRLDLRVGRVLVRDQFEWDLNSPENCPESFAEVLCGDLGLGYEFVPVIAHSIREQLLELAEFRDRRRAPAPLVESTVVRTDDVEAWEPVVECLSFDEQERIERKESREARLARRNRGKGYTIAELERRERRSSSQRAARRARARRRS